MVVKSFYLLGKDASVSTNVHMIEIDITHDLDAAQVHVADSYSIVDPRGVGFQTSGSQSIPDLDTLLDAEQPIAVTIDGHAVRKVPSPQGGLPLVGNFYQIYPDHIGNNQRLFERLGPVIQHTNKGRTWYLTNDPAISVQMFQENGFWSKVINTAHPLHGAKDNKAGLFLADTDTDTWRLAHKFLPPALAPKAIRNYTPMIQEVVQESFKVFDQFANDNEAFDVFRYMVKLTSQAVARLTLGLNLHHFDSADAPIASVVSDLTTFLALTKELSEMPMWYSHLPFGAPKKLRETQNAFATTVREAMKAAQSKEREDLPIATAALEADSMADFVARAVDEEGNKLPEEVAINAFPIIIGAGFATTSALMSWLMHAASMYPGMQDQLLQELVDHDVTSETQWHYDTVNDLHYLDKFIKETQRLFNPAFQPARTALRDQIMPGGYEVPKGTTLICSLHSLHRNPAVWDDPTAFNPDRWDTEKVRKRPAGSYVPFAMGPRSCIGFNFALSEAKTMFAELLYRYELIRYGDEAVDYDKEILIFKPDNLYIQLRRRTGWPAKSQ